MAWTLYEGDCLDIMPTLPDKSVDLVVTDPPYGVRVEHWDNRQLFLENLQRWLQESFRISRNGVLWFCAEKMLPDILRICGDKFQRLLIWDKPPGSQYAGAMHNKIWYSTEPILVLANGEMGKKGKSEPYSYATYKARTVPSKKYGHPTTKPIDLMEWLIKHYSDVCDTIFDPFAGSGTTAVAAERCGRNSILIEKEPKYCEIIRQRMAALDGGLFSEVSV